MIKKIQFKNMLSFGGNELNDIDFSESGISEIAGENGLGKSNITLLLKMAVYFDYPTKLTNVVNNNCTDGFLRVFYASGKIAHHEYTAKHGLNSLKVYSSMDKLEAGEAEDTGGIQATKEYLIKNEFNIPKKMFYNVFVPNIEKFKSFIGMSPQDSREIRDELFSLGGINDRLAKVKNAISKTNSTMSLSDSKLEELKQNIVDVEEKIKNVETVAAEENKNLIKTLGEDMETANSNEMVKSKELNDASTKVAEHKTMFDNWNIFNKREKLRELLKKSEELAVLRKKLEESVESLKESVSGTETYLGNKKYEEINQEIDRLNKQIETEEKVLADKTRFFEVSEYLIMVQDRNEKKEHKENQQRKHDEAAYDTRITTMKQSIDVMVDEYSQLMESKKVDERIIQVIELGENCPTCDQCVPLELRNTKPELLKAVEDKKAKLKQLLEKHTEAKDTLKAIEDERTTSLVEISKLEEQLNGFDEKLTNHKFAGDEQVLATKGVTKDELPKLSEEIKALNTLVTKCKDDKSVMDGKISTLTFTEGDFSRWSGNHIEELRGLFDGKKQELSNCVRDIEHVSDTMKQLETELIGKPDVAKPDVEESEVTSKLEHWESRKEALIKETTEIASNKTVLAEKLAEAEKFNPEEATKPLRELKEGYEGKMSEETASRADSEAYMEKLKVLEYVFSDSGMKKYILGKIRRGFTSQVNSDLNQFGLTAQFDDDFSVKMFKRGKEMDIISTGQKKVFDTIVCANFILLYSKKDGVKPPIILDECMSNLRAKWAEKLLRVLDSKLASKGFNVKFVNHERLNVNLSRKKINLHEKGLYTGISIES